MMRRSFFFSVVFAALVLGTGAVRAAPPPMSQLVRAELLSLEDAVQPGATLSFDVHFQVMPGWHIYWKNPGDSGLPTTIDWTLPAGFSAGAVRWPIPQRFAEGGIVNYGYTGSADLLVPVTAPHDLTGLAAVPIATAVKWLVCSNVCIPGETTLSLTLPVGTPGKVDPLVEARFTAAKMPLPLPPSVQMTFAAGPHELRIAVPGEALRGLERPAAWFYPDSDNVIDHSAEQKSVVRGNGLELILPRSTNPSAAVPKTLSGVLVLTGSDGTERGYQVAAERSPTAPTGSLLGGWQALIFALFGGLILNLMPCVFPILSLKLVSLVGAPPDVRHHHGLAYASGVTVSFGALGGALLALRAGGAAIGWGFQLQSPVVVALLAYLMLAMGLSLSGVAEFGAGLAGTGDRLAGRGGLVGAFFTGVLATVVATPCTAPFMAAALGAAVVAPGPLAVGIFLALGIGLAAPLLVASFVPALARGLPRPGAWMETLKQVLAFPLYGTVAWLIWVLIQEVAPPEAFAALIGLVLVGFAVWVYGRSRFAGPMTRRVGSGFAAAGLATAIGLAAMLPTTGAGAMPKGVAADGLAYQPFTPARLAELNAEHRPVFVNLTAAWCITCLVNERATLDRAAVRDAFNAHHVVPLKGDWTRQDPEIAAFLERFGRSGVPLYLLYDSTGNPTVLPQILTEAEVIDAIGKL